jgi:Trypsin-like serine proteases, typically periplasmic, contain C-terminal PDZ domain
MTVRYTLLLLTFFVAGPFAPSLSHADERIWLDGKINGKRVRLAFDTGSSDFALWFGTIEKLGLKFISDPTNDYPSGVLAGVTEVCDLKMAGARGKTQFLVLDQPGHIFPDFDGFIGWNFIGERVLQIDAIHKKIAFLSEVPKKATQWNRLRVFTKFHRLDVELPSAEGTNGVVCIDTGWQGGLELPESDWRRWKSSHPQSPTTLQAVYFPADGFGTPEQAWSDEIAVGPIVLNGVPIEQSPPGRAKEIGPQYRGSLGLTALKRMDFIVDAKNGWAYFRPITTPPPVFDHNRLGAVFRPEGIHTNQAVARVVKDSPAYEANVRDGDLLLQVNDVKVTSWSERWINQFYRPAGTKLELTLERNGEILKTTVTLRDILKPGLGKKTQ